MNSQIIPGNFIWCDIVSDCLFCSQLFIWLLSCFISASREWKRSERVRFHRKMLLCNINKKKKSKAFPGLQSHHLVLGFAAVCTHFFYRKSSCFSPETAVQISLHFSFLVLFSNSYLFISPVLTPHFMFSSCSPENGYCPTETMSFCLPLCEWQIGWKNRNTFTPFWREACSAC